MNWPHVHLVLNHVPIVGTGFCILLVLAAWKMKNRGVTLLALGFTVLVALSSLPVYFTGEPAEEVVEEIAGVSHDLIHEHEEAAEPAFFVMLGAGGLAIVGLWLIRKPASDPPKWLLPGVLLVLAITGVLMIRAASLGGQIQHPEIRPDFHAERIRT